MKALILSLLLVMIHSCAFAYATVWYDKGSILGKATKIVVFPIQGLKEYKQADSYLQDKLQEKVKKVYFPLLVAPNAQSQKLIEENQDYKYLTGYFPDEKARGLAVEEHLAADAYIIVKARENRSCKDYSPETKTTVTISTWMEESGGPDGYKKWNEISHEEEHIIPADENRRYLLTLDFYMYDTNGNKIMLCTASKEEYYKSEDDFAREFIKEYANEVKKAKKATKGGK